MANFLRMDWGWDGSPRLHDGTVFLRPPRPGDWQEWASLREASRAFLQPWEPLWADDELTRDGFRRRLRRYGDDMRAGTCAPFLVFRASDGALVGGINLNGIQRGVAQMCSVGYWVGEAHTRQGHARAALRLALEHGFGQLGLHRIEANCLPRNIPSRTLLETSGFAFEGLSRSYLKINGVWEDHLRFAMIAGERVR
jgi:[ribosomal protein S5]-alanine N-acetyltransferase